MSVTLSEPSVLLSLLNDKFDLGITFNISGDGEPVIEGTEIKGELSIARHFARENGIYGVDDELDTQIDQWINFAVETREQIDRFNLLIEDINWSLKYRTFIVGYGLTLADFVIFSTFTRLNKWKNVIKSNKKMKYKYTVRYIQYLSTLEHFDTAEALAEEIGCTDVERRVTTGVFDPLRDAVEGEVVVRFPPEPSGYLHIGHGKAAFTNYYYKNLYKGKLLLRFDDTNPKNEKEEFEEAIIKDLETMGIVASSTSHTSDHFDLIFSKAIEMINIGKAYMDDTDAETINHERIKKIESKHRNNSIEKNLEMWEEFVKGTEYGQTCVLRAKIDMQSNNGTMRDPVIYRYIGIPHNLSGDKFLVYPIYNFACPIVDSYEGVTHACRSNEYHDSEEQYYWFLENIPGCRPVYIQDFSRLNFSHTLMSKRKLGWFVNQGLVSGWDDPRFPTIQGMTRRGLNMSALYDFVIDLGNSKSAVLMEINKLWAFNKQFIDPIIPRYTVVRRENAVPCELIDITESVVEDVLKCKQTPELGTKKLVKSKNILFDQGDVQTLDDGEEFTIMDWGNIILQERTKEGDLFKSMTAVTNVGGDFKKTKKITWLSADDLVPCLLAYYDTLITVPSIPKGEDFVKYVNHDNYEEILGYCESAIKECNVGDSIQFTRRGYFRLDEIREDGTYVFINIPDGHQKNVWK